MTQVQKQATTVPTQEQPKKQRSTVFRVEEEKRIEINKAHSNRRQRAQVLKVLSIGLFGRRRYRNMYLISSLNNFYHALMIANTLQKRVEKLALVINMEKVKYTQHADEQAEGQQKDYSIFVIKITRNPTQEDKKSIGYNEGLQKIENPLTQIIKTRVNRAGGRDTRRGGAGRNFQRRDDRRGGDRRGGERRGGQRRERREDRRDYRPAERREDRRDERRGQRRTERRDDRRDNRPTQRREYREYQRRDNRGYDRGYERRQPERRYTEDRDRQFDRRPPRRYRQGKDQRVEQEEYRRGEKKTRGAPRVAQHDYKREHLNRQERTQDRRDRNPRRNNRYSSDED